jgi:hypothetical protein
MKESPTPWIDAAEIKRKVSIERVLAHYGLLERLHRKGDALRGPSPFRNETEPSFFVHLDGKWNDLGGRPVVDGKEVPGNIIGLVQGLEQCSFRQALLKLNELMEPKTSLRAHESNKPIPTESAVASVTAETKHKVEAAIGTNPLDEPLGPEPTETIVPKVIKRIEAGVRGVNTGRADVSATGSSVVAGPLKSESTETTATARSEEALVAFPSDGTEKRRKTESVLSQKGIVNEPFGRVLSGLKFDVPVLAERGLTAEKAKAWGVGYCSRGLMKNRVIVPIKNRQSEIVAYIGRSLKQNDPGGKWRLPNGFHKSLELFGIDRVASDLETQNAVAQHGLIVVEGCFDVIALVENGFKNVVATLGSEVSPEQLTMLLDRELNPTRRITVFFNNNAAGKQGRKRLFAQAIYRGYVRLVDFDRVDTDERTDPTQFTREELLTLLIP